MKAWSRTAVATLSGAMAVSLAVAGQSPTAAAPARHKAAAPPAPARTAAARATPRAADFARAAREFDVPRGLLTALAYGETHLDGHAGKPSQDNGYGVMHLVADPERNTVAQAAKRTGASADDLRHDAAANIRGGAAVLRSLADRAGLDAASRRDPGAWYPAVARYGGAHDDGLSRLYADAVYDILHKGASAHPAGAHGPLIRIAPERARPHRGAYATAPSHPGTESADYAKAHWTPADPANFATGRSAKITTIVIHVTEGSYAGTVNWFQNPKAQVSAHYVVRSSDGDITQAVRDKDTAYHARDANGYALGIEHEGYVDDASWFTDSMYRSSAALTKHLCAVHGIPKDRKHIVGHSEVPGNDHTDPGPHWDWDTYMKLVDS